MVVSDGNVVARMRSALSSAIRMLFICHWTDAARPDVELEFWRQLS